MDPDCLHVAGGEQGAHDHNRGCGLPHRHSADNEIKVGMVERLVAAFRKHLDEVELRELRLDARDEDPRRRHTTRAHHKHSTSRAKPGPFHCSRQVHREKPDLVLDDRVAQLLLDLVSQQAGHAMDIGIPSADLSEKRVVHRQPVPESDHETL